MNVKIYLKCIFIVFLISDASAKGVDETRAQEIAYCAGVLKQWAIGNQQLGNFDKANKLLNKAEVLAQRSVPVLGRDRTIYFANLGARYVAETINASPAPISFFVKLEKCENS